MKEAVLERTAIMEAARENVTKRGKRGAIAEILQFSASSRKPARTAASWIAFLFWARG
jgi:hypothetical protein